MEACLIITYRCNAKCSMCNTWQHQTASNAEFKPDLIDKLPNDLSFINITGGEPFLRCDIEEIIEKTLSKTRRLVISTNGYFTDRITKVFARFGNKLGLRISFEGLPATNDSLRGIKNGFDHGLRTLTKLMSMGIKDIGVAITVSDSNAKDMIELYRLADALGIEFATATVHNSYYFHKTDNRINNREVVAGEFEKIALKMLKSNKPKNWFRAYFNMGLARKVRGQTRALPCEVGTDMFFVDPSGNILPCNGSDEPMVMGNLATQSFDSIWHSERANYIRKSVNKCSKNCWMIGSASPAMKKRIAIPLQWIISCKLKSIFLKNFNQLPPI
ncbi:MAG: radical SAM protein [Deltaproteobacteria bacterium]|nr:MAG: radical SAM protein [Deltaproteobacteria bacterium]